MHLQTSSYGSCSSEKGKPDLQCRWEESTGILQPGGKEEEREQDPVQLQGNGLQEDQRQRREMSLVIVQDISFVLSQLSWNVNTCGFQLTFDNNCNIVFFRLYSNKIVTGVLYFCVWSNKSENLYGVVFGYRSTGLLFWIWTIFPQSQLKYLRQLYKNDRTSTKGTSKDVE